MSETNYGNAISGLASIEEYPNRENLVRLCKSFEGQKLKLYAEFMGKTLQICNCNAVGDILEDVFYPKIKHEFDDFEEGLKQ